ncbi:MAG: GGDEF domain-containing protein [Lachnospiraceae bacterium]|nr:GGDEF domain-containing protein [Lachnospiraceae bacterium]
MLNVQYGKLEQRMVNEYTRMADGITQLITNSIDGDRIDEYVKGKFVTDEYNTINKYLYSLRDNYPDVYYLYVYKITPEGATVVFDLDDEYSEIPTQESLDWIGSTYELDEPFASKVDILMSGKEDLFYAVHTQDDEYLLSYVAPILDSKGNYAASACVDFSMAEMHAENLNFTISLGLILLGIMALILFICMLDMNRVLIKPVNNLINCIHGFKYDTNEDRNRNVKLLEGCVVNTDNQIEELRKSLLTSMKDTASSLSELTMVRDEMNEITEIVRKDALTSVGSKAYYDEVTEKLQKEMQEKEVEFAIVMIDLNNLKKVNDTYGHDKGNAFIINSCRIACRIYKKSPVFRLGGDEFVVLLQGKDYEKRNELLEELKREYEESYNDSSKPEYERYSASLGMAEFIPGKDKSVEDTFKRADGMMYSSKKEFKAKYGSYR